MPQAPDRQASRAGTLLGRWWTVPGLIALFLTLYASVLITPYAFSDDYSLLAESVQGETTTTRAVVAAGRPTYALLLGVTLRPLDGIEDLRYIRLLGVVALALLCWRLYRALVLAGWEDVQACLLALVMISAPGFQVCGAWATAAFFPYAALLSGGAWMLTERALAASRKMRALSLAAGAVLLLLAALTIYQPAALFYWVFAAVMLFRPGAALPEVRQRLRWYGAVVSAGLVLGFGVYRLGQALYPRALGAGRSSLVGVEDVVNKAVWFFDRPLTDAFNLILRFYPDWRIALLVAGFVVAGLFCYFSGSVKARIGQVLIALALLPLSYLPNLIAAENWTSYRTQVALASLVILYVFLASMGYRRRLLPWMPVTAATAALALAALASGFSVVYNTRAFFVVPQQQEWELLRSQLAAADLDAVSGIRVIGSTWRGGAAPGVRHDEFGLPSSSQAWVIKPMVFFALRQLHPEFTYRANHLAMARRRSWLEVEAPRSAVRAPIALDVEWPESPAAPGRDALVIDMRQLASLR